MTPLIDRIAVVHLVGASAWFDRVCSASALPVTLCGYLVDTMLTTQPHAGTPSRGRAVELF